MVGTRWTALARDDLSISLPVGETFGIKRLVHLINQTDEAGGNLMRIRTAKRQKIRALRSDLGNGAKGLAELT